MPKYAVNPETGERLLYDDRAGQWRPPTDAEVRIDAMGFAGEVASFVEGATGLGAMAGLVNESAAEAAAAGQSINPLASTAGFVSTLPAGIAPMARSGARMLGRRSSTMANRVQDRVAQSGQAGDRMGFRRMPDEMLPSSMSGAGQLVRAGATATIPGRLVSDMLIRTPNQRNLNRLVGRALRLTDDELKAAGGKIDDNLYGVIQQRTDDAYREIAGRIGQVMDKSEVDKLALKMNQDGLITNRELLALTDQAADAGESIMALRSSARAAQRGEQSLQVRNMVQDTVDQIDDTIKRSLKESDDEITMQLYQDANARYKMELALEKGNVLGRDGNISPTLLDTQLRKLFGDAYRAGTRNTRVPLDVGDALLGARTAQGMNIGLPSSGTAERQIAAGLLGTLTGGTIGSSL